MPPRRRKTDPPPPPPTPAGPYDYIAEPLRPLAVELTDLADDPRNARTHDEPNLAAIAASLKRFGLRKPLVANRRTGQVEAGHGTLAAARRLGWTHLAVVWVDDDPATATGFSLADNRTAELAAWDQAALDALLLETRQGDADLYEALRLADLLTAVEAQLEPAPAEDGAAPAAVVPAVWQVIVECADEADQRELFDRLQADGRTCRLLTM